MNDDRRQARLVLLAQAGNPGALDDLLRELQGPLHAYLARLCGDRHLAEDVLQDTFVLICRKLPWLREPQVLRPWAYRIASREAFRRLKSERRREQASGEAVAELAGPEGREDGFPTEWIECLPG